MSKKTPNNQEIAKLLREISAAYEAKGENHFRIRAYDNAADAIEHASTPLSDLWQQDKLHTITGIGPNIASHLDELFKTGRVKHFTQVKKSLPGGMFALLDVPGIGPKTAHKLAKKFKLNSQKTAIAELKQAAKKGLVAPIEGFGEKSQQEILGSVNQTKPKSTRTRIDVAHTFSQDLLNYLQKSPAVFQVSTMGSLRRRSSTVGDVDFGTATTDPSKVQAHIKNYPQTKKVLASGKGLVRLIHHNGQQIDVKMVKPESFGSLLQHATGSKAHNIHLRELALKKGLSLSEHGIKIKGKLKPFASEEKFYKFLGLQWIPPELREDTGEIEAAATGKLPSLIKLTDIKGDLHTHSNYNWKSSHDYGQNSFKELVSAAKSKHYQYFALGDHNPSLKSSSDDQITSLVKKRSQKIDSLSSGSLHLLKTLEVDIRPDGNLALPPEAAKLLDFITASVHSSLRQPKAVITKRIIKAINTPKVKILGHPTGRLINSRPGYELDWPQVFKACKSHGVALEINSHPARLDINDQIIKQAIKQNIKLAINTDTHSLTDLDNMSYGIDVARRGWATKANVINTWPWLRLKSWLGV